MHSKGSKYPDFKWAFSTLGCPELSLDEICAVAREFGLSFLEVRAVEGQLDLPKLFSDQFSNAEALNQYLHDRELNICCLDTSLKLVENEADDRRAFLEFLPWADAIESPYLRVFDGGTVAGGLDDPSYAKAMDTLEWWHREKETGGWNVEIAIETHDCLVHTKSCQRLLANYPDLRFIWDTHHTWKKGNDSIENSWNQLRQNTCSVHIKDSISQPSSQHPFTYVNLGDGEFPLSSTLDLLMENQFRGYVTIEWERLWHPYLTNISDALTRAKDLNWF